MDTELLGHLVAEIRRRAMRDGPLGPLAGRLDHDVTHLQLATVSQAVHSADGKLDRIAGMLASLVRGEDSGGRAALARGAVAEPAYWATVAVIRRRTAVLAGRDRELAEIAEFAAGSDGYRWLAGEPFAGKTALLARAAAELRATCDVVCYFLSRREADADSARFLAAVVPQLAWLAGEEAPAADVHLFRALWQRAARRAEATERQLVLIVDGLDEDARPPGLPSVAALLPDDAGGRVHVLVSSQPHPDLPADVPPGHPLRRAVPVRVEPFAGADESALLARQEIDGLLRRDDDGLAADVLGLLAAAAGPLSIEDPGQSDRRATVGRDRQTAAFSPDGKILAVADAGGNISLWDPASRRLASSFAYPGTGSITGIAFSPDGKTLAIFDDNNYTYLTALPAGAGIAALAGPFRSGGAVAVAFSPDGKTLANFDYGRLYLWNTATRHLVTTWTSPGIKVLAFSPDGKTLTAVYGNGTTRQWKPR